MTTQAYDLPDTIGCWSLAWVVADDEYPYRLTATVISTDATILNCTAGEIRQGRGKTPDLALAYCGLIDLA